MHYTDVPTGLYRGTWAGNEYRHGVKYCRHNIVGIGDVWIPAIQIRTKGPEPKGNPQVVLDFKDRKEIGEPASGYPVTDRVVVIQVALAEDLT